MQFTIGGNFNNGHMDDKYVDLRQRGAQSAEEFEHQVEVHSTGRPNEMVIHTAPPPTATVVDDGDSIQEGKVGDGGADVGAGGGGGGGDTDAVGGADVDANADGVTELKDMTLQQMRSLAHQRALARRASSHHSMDPVFRFRGSTESFVRRRSDYFNSTKRMNSDATQFSRTARLGGPNGVPVKDDIANLKNQAVEHKKAIARANCMAAASKAGITPLIVVLVWIVTGTLFYHFYTGFYWSQAFFYAVDTGFSIGFGMFVEGAWNDSAVYIPAEACTLQSCEDGGGYNGSLRQACVQLEYRPDVGSMLYTVAHILVGSSLVATALTMMLVGTLDRSGLNTKERKLLKDNLDREKIRKAEELQFMRRRARLRQSLSQADLLAKELREARVRRAKRKWKKCWRAVVKLTLGMVFVVFSEQWSFVEALYFAISSLSTAGLLGPTHHIAGNESSEACSGDCRPLGMALVGIYCFVGVPLFAMVLGSAADFQIDRMQEIRLQAKFKKAIGIQEFQFAEEKLRRSSARVRQKRTKNAVTQTDGGVLRHHSERQVAVRTRKSFEPTPENVSYVEGQPGAPGAPLELVETTSAAPTRQRAPSRHPSTQHTLDFLQYLQLSLLRTGLVEEDKLSAIWKQFELLDVDDSGDVSLSEVAAMNIFNKYDVDASATLDLLEFFLCIDDLRHAFPDVTYAEDEEDLSIVFIKISSIVVDKDGNMHVPDWLDEFLEKWLGATEQQREEEIRDRFITRLQFLVWCKDKVRHSYVSTPTSDATLRPTVDAGGKVLHRGHSSFSDSDESGGGGPSGNATIELTDTSFGNPRQSPRAAHAGSAGDDVLELAALERPMHSREMTAILESEEDSTESEEGLELPPAGKQHEEVAGEVGGQPSSQHVATARDEERRADGVVPPRTRPAVADSPNIRRTSRPMATAAAEGGATLHAVVPSLEDHTAGDSDQ